MNCYIYHVDSKEIKAGRLYRRCNYTIRCISEEGFYRYADIYVFLDMSDIKEIEINLDPSIIESISHEAMNVCLSEKIISKQYPIRMYVVRAFPHKEVLRKDHYIFKKG